MKRNIVSAYLHMSSDIPSPSMQLYTFWTILPLFA